MNARAAFAVTLAIAAAFTAAVALGFHLAWRPPPDFYVYNLPIAAPFAAFFADRALTPSRRLPLLAVDAAALGLALLRVVAPPLPFASGHALFTAYAAATAQQWPLRLLAIGVFVQVSYLKLFAGGGAWSWLAGVAAAALLSTLRRYLRASRASACSASGRAGASGADSSR